MALQKDKALASGVSGNYWRVSSLSFTRANMMLSMTIDLYKDSTPGLLPLGLSHRFAFELTPQDLAGNLVAMAYSKIKECAENGLPNIDGHGCADLVGAVDV